jgi:hypothetical protein
MTASAEQSIPPAPESGVEPPHSKGPPAGILPF